MDRKDILASPEYWVTLIQTNLYDCAVRYMKSANINRTQLAEQLGVSKGYVSQLLNGNFDHRLSKLVELSLAFGCLPKIEFVKKTDYNIQAQSIYGEMGLFVSNDIGYHAPKKFKTKDDEWDSSMELLIDKSVA